MKIHYNNDIKITNATVTIGSFDGVHIGHLAILSKLKEIAMANNGESVVITFSPHPRVLLGNDSENLFFLNSMKEKIYLLEQAGIDNLVVMSFDTEVAKQTMEQFLTNYIKRVLNASTIVVGYNHRFGSDYNSNYNTLVELGKRENIDVVRVDKKGIDERDISSTTIRNAIMHGDISRANTYLSYPYMFISDIDKTGIALYSEKKKLYPPVGSYKVKVIKLDGTYVDSTAQVDSRNVIKLSNIDESIKDAKILFL